MSSQGARQTLRRDPTKPVTAAVQAQRNARTARSVDTPVLGINGAGRRKIPGPAVAALRMTSLNKLSHDLLAAWICKRCESMREILPPPERRLRQDGANIVYRLANRRNRPGYAAPALPS